MIPSNVFRDPLWSDTAFTVSLTQTIILQDRDYPDFSFSYLNILFHCLLASIVSDDKLAINVTSVPL